MRCTAHNPQESLSDLREILTHAPASVSFFCLWLVCRFDWIKLSSTDHALVPCLLQHFGCYRLPFLHP